MQENFVYHRVVQNMQGTTLYPLNALKNIYPEAYDEHVKKYVGRESLLETQIPVLDCLWNDVIHLTAVPPQELVKNLIKGGMKAQNVVWSKWYKIPASLLNKENTIVCLYKRNISVTPDARDFFPFEPNDVPKYRDVTDKTIEYYKEQFALGKRPLMFHLVPHILFKGTIETGDLEIVTV